MSEPAATRTLDRARPSQGLLGPLRLTRPTWAEVDGTVRSMAAQPLSYSDHGATLRTMPPGWHHDTRVRDLGPADRAWAPAVRALRSWTQFDLDWVWPHDRACPITPGADFAFTSRQLGLWSVNVCRVVEVIDEATSTGARFGFAYGTLGAHVVRGEELFLVERDGTGRVRFTIRKFSRPAHPLVQVALPVARALQRRFSEDALARIAREVGG